MGVGKGRTARALASIMNMYPLDCDDLIESHTNKKIKEIFKVYGESHFRELERKTALWLENSVKRAIISTGGGFINVPNLKKIGHIVYLQSDFSAIMSGLQNHKNHKKKIKKRPLLKNIVEAESLYNTRLPLYRELADYVVEVEGKSSELVATAIQNWIQQK